MFSKLDLKNDSKRYSIHHIGTFLMFPQDTENITKEGRQRGRERDTGRLLTKSWLHNLGKNKLYKP